MMPRSTTTYATAATRLKNGADFKTSNARYSSIRGKI